VSPAPFKLREASGRGLVHAHSLLALGLTACLLLPPGAQAQTDAPAEVVAPRPVAMSVGMRSNRPTLAFGDNLLVIQPAARFDLDLGSFWAQNQDPLTGRPPRFPGAPNNNVNIRRARLGLQGSFLGDFTYAFIWQFEVAPGSAFDGGSFSEAWISYNGLRGGVLRGSSIRAGAFTIPATLEASTSTFQQLFLERPSIITMAGGIASGDNRFAAGGEFYGDRWWVGGYVTNGLISTINDSDARGFAGRAAGLVVNQERFQLQLGVNGTTSWRPGTNASESVRFRDYPELRFGPLRLLDTRSIPANGASSLGPEVSGRVGNLVFLAEYQSLRVDAKDGTSPNFSGWYIAAVHPILGPARQRSASRAVWALPRFTAVTDGGFGYLEAALRYSTANANSGSIQGGRQSIFGLALNWFPTTQLRLTGEYQVGTVALPASPDRDFQSFALRLSFNL
jgi:phosphate-selective porin OprO/OprP